jgi:hypothetical protein
MAEHAGAFITEQLRLIKKKINTMQLGCALH